MRPATNGQWSHEVLTLLPREIASKDSGCSRIRLAGCGTQGSSHRTQVVPSCPLPPLPPCRSSQQQATGTCFRCRPRAGNTRDAWHRSPKALRSLQRRGCYGWRWRDALRLQPPGAQLGRMLGSVFGGRRVMLPRMRSVGPFCVGGCQSLVNTLTTAEEKIIFMTGRCARPGSPDLAGRLSSPCLVAMKTRLDSSPTAQPETLCLLCCLHFQAAGDRIPASCRSSAVSYLRFAAGDTVSSNVSCSDSDHLGSWTFGSNRRSFGEKMSETSSA